MKSRKLMPETAGKAFWSCKSAKRKGRGHISLNIWNLLNQSTRNCSRESSPGLAGEPTGLAKRSFLGLPRGCCRGSELFLSFTTTVWWTTLLFPSCQWIRGKSSLRSKIFPPRWRINRRQIPMSHSSASLLIVLGMSLPPSYAAIGPY